MVDERLVKIGSGQPGQLSRQLFEAVVNIHRGRAEDRFGWCREIKA